MSLKRQTARLILRGGAGEISPRDRLRLILQLLVTVGVECSAVGRRQMLILDDVDQLPTILQHRLIDFLTPGSHSWPNGLTVLIPIRMATYRDGIAAVYIARYKFSGPEPGDVLFQRLTRFLAAPELAYEPYDEMPEDAKKACYSRLAELWLALADRRGWLRTALDAVAGSNIRHGLDLAEHWALSRVHRRTLEVEPDAFKLEVLQMLSPFLADECAEACARTFMARFNASMLTRARASSTSDWISIVVATSMSAVRLTASEFVDNMGLVGGQNADEREMIEAFGASAALAAAEALLTALARPVSGREGPSLGSLREAELEELAGELQAHCAWTGAAFSAVDQLVSTFAKCLRDRVAQTAGGTNGPRSAAMSALWSLVHKMGHAQGVGRFLAARVLLASHDTSRNLFAERVVNVFSHDRKVIRAIGLRILALLKDAGQAGILGRDLIEDARRQNVDEHELAAALGEMLRSGTRLVYCTRKDEIAGVEDLQERSHLRFSLSLSGLNYIDHLVSSPAYLQIALCEVACVQALIGDQQSGAGGRTSGGARGILWRVDRVIYGLSEMLREEFDRLRILQEEVEGHTGLKVLYSPSRGVVSLDAFMRAMGSYIYPLFSHRGRMSKVGDTGEVQRVDSLLARFIELGASSLDKFDQHFDESTRRYVGDGSLQVAWEDWHCYFDPLRREVQGRVRTHTP